jgi:hypothetical protein
MLIYMLSKSAKLQWGLGHTSLKMVYEGALVPLMTYGALPGRTLLLKIPPKDAKCTEADKQQYREGVQNHLLRSILSDGRSPTHWNCDLQLYKRKHRIESNKYKWDMPLPVIEWPHPARRVNIMETSAQTTYPTKIYTDSTKVRGKVGAGVAIYSDKWLMRQCKYRL